MTKIQGYLWHDQRAAEKDNLNICVNPRERALLSSLLLPPNPPTQINLSFGTLPKGNPRCLDAPNTRETLDWMVPIENLLLIITDQADGFIRCHRQPNLAQCVIHASLLRTFIDHIQECQENAYLGEVTMPLCQGNRAGQLVFWTWHQKEAIYV